MGLCRVSMAGHGRRDVGEVDTGFLTPSLNEAPFVSKLTATKFNSWTNTVFTQFSYESIKWAITFSHAQLQNHIISHLENV